MLLTLNEVCERLLLSRKTVIKLIDSGELEASRVGTAGIGGRGAYRITEEALARYLESRKVESAAAAS
jgi:excisionase family DNA binding protein